MWLELREVFDSLSTDAEVRAVVLTGAGDRAFSAGLDVQAAGSSLFQTSTLDGSRQAAAKRRHITEFQGCVSAIERCEKPVICAMHGYAFGLAIDIAVCADVRLCSADAVFAVKEVDIGLAADVGSLNRLPKIVGNFGWVKDVCLTARQFRPAEAEKVGFVTGVYPDKAQAVTAAIEWASLVATKSPVAVQGTKELLNWSRDRNVQDGKSFPYDEDLPDDEQGSGTLRCGTGRLFSPVMCNQL